MARAARGLAVGAAEALLGRGAAVQLAGDERGHVALRRLPPAQGAAQQVAREPDGPFEEQRRVVQLAGQPRECGVRGDGPRHDFARAVAGEVVQRRGEDGGEVHVQRELDDEDRVRAVVPRDVAPVFVSRSSFALVPAGESRWPVRVQAGEAALSQMFDQVFRGEAEDSGDDREIRGARFFEVPM